MPDLQTTKPCTACKRELPFSAYHKHAKGKHGLRPKCKDCIHIQRTAYYERKADKHREYSRGYYAENAPKVIEYQSRYVKKNRKKVSAFQKQYRAENRERLLTEKQTYYAANRERFAELSKKWRQANPQAAKVYLQRRRALKRKAPGVCTPEQWHSRIAFYGSRCYLCRVHLTSQTITMDHRIPLIRGGSNWPSNLAPACVSCNCSKQSLTEMEYRRKLL